MHFQSKQTSEVAESGTGARRDYLHEYLQCHLENAFWKVGMKRRDVLTQNLGGRTKVFKMRVSVDNLMELLEGVVLLIKAVLLCHSGAGKASNYTAVAHSTLW